MQSKPINTKLDLFPVAAGVWGMRDKFVNVFMVKSSEENNWVLIDTGLKSSASKIKRMARLIFGEDARPSAILLTHGHFDHVGSVAQLSAYWDVPVYAHHYEMPYLTGLSSYPPGDPTVRGGIMSDLSGFFPRTPINIESRVVALPEDHTVPFLPGWTFIHTPGHSPGHVSFFREKDRLLISGDAVVTTKAESAWYTFLQLKTLSGPPRYFTSDWLSAAASVEDLARLEPEILASGHGRPMRGSGMRKSLHNLAEHFDKLAVPFHGRYVHQPVLADDTGVVHIPPRNQRDIKSPNLKLLAVGGALVITWLLLTNGNKKRKIKKAAIRDQELADKYLSRQYLEGKEKGVEKKADRYRSEAERFSDKATKEAKRFARKAEKTVDHVTDKAGRKASHVKEELKQAAKPVKHQIEMAERSTKKAVNKLPAWLETLDASKFKVKKNLFH